MRAKESLSFKDQIKLIRATKHMHVNWYLERYPDVRAVGMHPAEHYLRIGAEMGRNPGKHFDTRFYLKTYPDAAKSGMNPLLHYALIGRGKRYRTTPQRDQSLDALRSRLLSLGFEAAPLAELDALSADARVSAGLRAAAARELALWTMRSANAARTAGDTGQADAAWSRALDWLARARDLAALATEGDGGAGDGGAGADQSTDPDREPEWHVPDLGFRARLSVAELLCHYHLGRPEAGLAAYERAALAGEASDDVMLARTTLDPDPGQRLVWINAVLARHAIPPLALMPASDSNSGIGTGTPYDRLCCAQPLPAVTDGPLVTVLIAAWQAADTLPAALRALQEQTWKNLEILVLDDASPDPGTMRVAQAFAARDPRIRAIRMPVNGGAYVARNHGLTLARGEFVTLHDADDWAHPLRIETQMRHITAHPRMLGCLTLQARMRDDLCFTRWTGDGHFIIPNTSSFLFRRDPVSAEFGGWDRVRISADNELIRRIRHVHGRSAVVQMEGGPLAFQRDGDSSVVADEFLGINGFLYGARRAYAEAQTHYRKSGGDLHYSGTARPFPVPALLRPDRPARGRHIPVVLGSEFRMQGGSLNSCLEEMRFHRDAGLGLGLVELFRHDLYAGIKRENMLEPVRALLDGETIEQVVYGDHVSCDLLILRYPPCLWHEQRYLPRIDAREIKVIVNQPPLSDYGPEGVQRYDIAACADNIRRWFGGDASWHPIGPLVRSALQDHHADELHHIHLSGQDWHNIIDLSDWEPAPRRRGPQDRLRIGRHARDHVHKWPDRAEDIRAAWPDSPDVEVHVLGGANTAAALLGGVPSNWVVHPFGSRDPRDFLADLDVWIYFAHPDWVESFGRTIIEAMAMGVPVILPEVYRPLFGEAALYATPQTAMDIARRLHADPAAHAAQADLARAHVRDRFSHDTHRRRLLAAGVSGLAPPVRAALPA